MKIALLALLLGAACAASARSSDDDRLYELRTYHTFPGKLDALHQRFQNHTIELFARHGMASVGYWTPVGGDGQTLIYLLEFESHATREAGWKAFLDDPEWKAVFAASIEDGRLVERIDSVLLQIADFSPKPALERRAPPRLFELRTYRAAPGRLTDLNARFRNATLDLFAKHGMENVIYLHPIEPQHGAGDTLIYFLAHESREARDASFRAFGEDPEWQAARSASEEKAGGALTQPGGVTHQFLEPTQYSPLQ